MAVLIQKIGGLYFEANRWRQEWRAVEDATGKVVAENRASFGRASMPDPKTPPDSKVVDVALTNILAHVVAERAQVASEQAVAAVKANYIAAQGFGSAEELVAKCIEKGVDLRAATADVVEGK